ncbi:hypothetical protein AAY473_006865 [Plecturocebus cupreus]
MFTNSYVEILTPKASKYKLIWKKAYCQCNQVGSDVVTLEQLECSGVIVVHCSLELLASSATPTLASQVARMPGAHHRAWLIFFLETGSHYVAHAGLELLSLSHSPALASRSAGIIGMSHCAWPPHLRLLISVQVCSCQHPSVAAFPEAHFFPDVQKAAAHSLLTLCSRLPFSLREGLLGSKWPSSCNLLDLPTWCVQGWEGNPGLALPSTIGLTVVARLAMTPDRQRALFVALSADFHNTPV